MEAIGKANNQNYIPPNPATLLSIMYTSGTTGMPKGALITHGNMTSAVIGQAHGHANTEAGDVTLSYLPLSHIYEQFVEIICLLCGGHTQVRPSGEKMLANRIILPRHRHRLSLR